jgi:hypothetical protein
MRKYIYKTVPSVVEETYLENAKTNIYEDLGKVNFDNVKLLVLAGTEEEADATRKGITDIRMWVLDKVEE